MPRCGSQITICDLPVRFDTYEGCTHACGYCFVKMKRDISQVDKGEGVTSLINFINGERTNETAWCDWKIPLHWGGVSDPLQPAEAVHGLSYQALQIFAKSQYPFVISTKGALLGEDKYLDLIKQCNCVVQVSLVSPQYDKIEVGAPTFTERLEIIKKIAPHVKRVVIRVQPYTLEVHEDLIKQILLYKEAGVYGITIEGMKYKRKISGLVKVGGDFCYPTSILKKKYKEIKDLCKEVGIEFYCAENRLRYMGKNLCCCGIDGLEGFTPNKYNLNHYLYDKENFTPTKSMTQKGSCGPFKAICQNTISVTAFKNSSLEDMMRACTKDKNMIMQLTDKL